MTEVFKIVDGLSPPIMHNFFKFGENTHNISNFQIISTESRRILRYGQETIKFRTPWLWPNVPEEYKLVNSLIISKRKIKNCKCQTCPCPLCQNLQKYLYLLTYLFVVIFVRLVFFFSFPYCAGYEWMNFQLLRSVTNRENPLHQLIKSSLQGNILLLLLQYW